MPLIRPVSAIRAEENALLAPFCAAQPTHYGRASAPGDGQRFTQRLTSEGLACQWASLLGGNQHSALVDALDRRQLEGARRDSMARYLLQRRSIELVNTHLAKAQIPCAVIKGAALRERLYSAPSDRPAADVDLLIPRQLRDAALQRLCALGLTLTTHSGTVSHEATLDDGLVQIDLHWALFRPGRSRIDLAPVLLETRRIHAGLPMLSDDANLLIMLTHSAITKHVCGPESRLIRALDLDRHLRTLGHDWDWILPLIDAAGLRYAAWATLHWLRGLLDTPVEPWVLAHLRPGTLQRRYLSYWIDHRLPARLPPIPGLIQGGFSLALHERPADAVRALTMLARCHLSAGRTRRLLDGIRRAANTR